MNRDVSSFIERYQILYEKDPDSKVFAPLAEAYRRMGLVDEAIDLALRGVEKHPHFASGRVALGKCFAQKGLFDKAVEQLQAAVDLSPENLLAHQLLAECYLKIKSKNLALNSFKMVLFLNPNDEKAAVRVRKLEAELFAGQDSGFAADEPEEEYAMGPLEKVLKRADPKVEEKVIPVEAAPERELALLDSRFDRGDWPAAKAQLKELLERYPGDEQLISRKQYVDELSQNSFTLGDWLKPIKPEPTNPKLEKLQQILERVEARRKA